MSYISPSGHRGDIAVGRSAVRQWRLSNWCVSLSQRRGVVRSAVDVEIDLVFVVQRSNLYDCVPDDRDV